MSIKPFVVAAALLPLMVFGGKPSKVVRLDLARQMETVSFVKEFIDKVAAAEYNSLVLYLK